MDERIIVSQVLKEDERIIVSQVLKEIAEALNEGAAGPTDYWFRKLAERLLNRSEKLAVAKKEIKSGTGEPVYGGTAG